MADTNFTDNVTPIVASWLNDVNNLVYTIFENPSDKQEAVEALPLVTQVTDGIMSAGDKTKLDGLGGNSNVFFGIKTSDTTQTLDNVTINIDPDMSISLAANTLYSVECCFIFDVQTGAGGTDLGFGLPSGSTGNFIYTQGTTTRTGTQFEDTNIVGLLDLSGVSVNEHTGFVLVGGTAGNITFNWRKQISNAAFTTLKEGSWLKVTGVQ